MGYAIKLSNKSTFLTLENDVYFINLFINCVSKLSYSDIDIFFSKLCFKPFDLKVFENINNNYKHLLNINNKNKSIKKHSILVINETTQNFILHIYLVYELDSFSSWKIYMIESEY